MKRLAINETLVVTYWKKIMLESCEKTWRDLKLFHNHKLKVERAKDRQALFLQRSKEIEILKGKKRELAIM